MTKPTVLTIILNYKTAEMTLQSLAAARLAMGGIAGEIIVVDNDSGDGSYETIRDAVAQKGWDQNNRVRVLQSGHNGGFGAGNNFGIRAGLSDGGKPDFVYILNSDAFPAKDAISTLLDYLQSNPQAGFAGSYIHGPEGDPHLTAFRFPSIASELEGAARFGPISRLLSNHIVPLPMPAQTCKVDWISGASLMMRQTTLDEIGLFDEVFFLYFEETDLCRRAARAGWPLYYLPQSKVAHIGSVSTGLKTWTRMPQYWFDSRRHYFVKNHGHGYAALATLAHVAGGGLYRLRILLQRKPRLDPKLFLFDMVLHSFKSAAAGLFSGQPKTPTKKSALTGQEAK